VTLVTTLLDSKLYTRIALAQLYGFRWPRQDRDSEQHAEIDLKHLKTTMQMEHLPSKTPQMVVKDFYMHLMAYNLIRKLQLEASSQHNVDPLALSFCATIQHLLLVTRGSVEPHYDWILTTEINSNPCPNWV